MSGHGWIIKNPNGMKARCGGPGICSDCAHELDAIMLQIRAEFRNPNYAERRQQTWDMAGIIGDKLFEAADFEGAEREAAQYERVEFEAAQPSYDCCF